MKKQLFVVALCGTLLLGTGLNAMAFEKGGRGDGEGFRRGPQAGCRMGAASDPWKGLLAKLDLTESQQQEVKKLTEGQRDKAKEHRKQMIEIRQQMRQAMQPQSFNEKTLRRLSAEQAKIKTELMVTRAATRSKIYALLTPEQKELVDLSAKLHRLQGPGAQGRRDCSGPMGHRGQSKK